MDSVFKNICECLMKTEVWIQAQGNLSFLDVLAGSWSSLEYGVFVGSDGNHYWDCLLLGLISGKKLTRHIGLWCVPIFLRFYQKGTGSSL